QKRVCDARLLHSHLKLISAGTSGRLACSMTRLSAIAAHPSLCLINQGLLSWCFYWNEAQDRKAPSRFLPNAAAPQKGPPFSPPQTALFFRLKEHWQSYLLSSVTCPFLEGRAAQNKYDCQCSFKRKKSAV